MTGNSAPGPVSFFFRSWEPSWPKKGGPGGCLRAHGLCLRGGVAFFFVESFDLVGNDMIYIPLMCVLCVAIPFVLVTIAPRFIPAEEVNLFFLLETIIGPIWVWMIIKEQPSIETVQGGIVIIITIAIHSFLKLKKS